MFLHLGGEVIVPKKDIIAIIDLESSLQGVATQEFLNSTSTKRFNIKIAEEGKEKSLVLTDKYIYFSPISSNTLMKRGNNFTFMVKQWEESVKG
ncbi:DUF370 domain-containing protein [Heliorestis acidaminivorans]|uniref:DUF370 domain-containing protein n=1 Tax=Heliorestis acidaminivorans TaxID=553427 RepID=A0A6I0F2Z6_9FIRM|nr:extracellular matrix/biofilm biosynthesis regulator RemA family protein [Heliorestis acidaminivorans]KAB2953930.1 DUF370 domain-containing protein [Heliorestis acidaminivorans]